MDLKFCTFLLFFTKYVLYLSHTNTIESLFSDVTNMSIKCIISNRLKYFILVPYIIMYII